MGRNLIVGDIHSRFNKLVNVLEKAKFNADEDVLYSVGDFCDRGEDAVKTIRFLMSLKNFKAVVGNHDEMLQNWLNMDYDYNTYDDTWTDYNGGNKTVEDFKYNNPVSDEERKRIGLWLQSFPYVRVEKKYIIVHGGIPSSYSVEDLVKYQKVERDPYNGGHYFEPFTWDREYLFSAFADEIGEFDENENVPPLETDKTIFLGHTPLKGGKPFFSKKYHMVAIDTGAGGNGPLTLMDMDTFEYWQD